MLIHGDLPIQQPAQAYYITHHSLSLCLGSLTEQAQEMFSFKRIEGQEGMEKEMDVHRALSLVEISFFHSSKARFLISGQSPVSSREHTLMKEVGP